MLCILFVVSVACRIDAKALLYSLSTTNRKIPEPPDARREEERFVYIGVAPQDWDDSVPRQSETSTNHLLDPPKELKDPYGWLRDETRSQKEVLAHLEAENDYTNLVTRELTTLQDSLYNEMVSFLRETSHSFPSSSKSFYYYRRTIEGQSYPLHCRAPKDDSSTSGDYLKEHLTKWDGTPSMPILPGEKVYLDESKLANGHDYFEIGSIEISPSQELVAYTVDYTANEIYQLIIQRIDTGHVIFRDSSLLIDNNIVWGLDDSTLFYTKLDDAQRTYQVYRRDFRLGWGDDAEFLMYEETDVLYWVWIYKSMDENYLMVGTESSESSEIHYLNLKRIDGSIESELTCIASRSENVLYTAEHFKGTWWITSNIHGATDLQLWTVSIGEENWLRVLDPKTQQPLLDGVAIEELSVFAKHVVIEGRQEGIPQIWILEIDDDSQVLDWQRLEWTEEAARYVRLASNLVTFNSSTIIVGYQSLVTPLRYIEVPLASPDQRKILTDTPVPGYQKDLYACQRIYTTSRDGRTQIPVSLVYLRSTLEKVESAEGYIPVHLYAYGAYGESIEDSFSSSILPLLNRGVMYAVAHVRGGGEMGRPWYENGKLMSKKNTFNDFIDVARDLIEGKQWTTSELLSIEGRSAGGLTIGASLNQAPDLFRVAILGVPFVDLVATMSDASIPLTAGEWEEWGNPNEEQYYDYMMDYSPMNSVKGGEAYPSMLILAGLFDPRVAYWEPAKFAATLRNEVMLDSERPICLKTDMTSGHFSASDRYKYITEKAFEYAFLLHHLGILK